MWGRERQEEERPKVRSLEVMPFGCWIWLGCMVMIAVWLMKKCF